MIWMTCIFIVLYIFVSLCFWHMLAPFHSWAEWGWSLLFCLLWLPALLLLIAAIIAEALYAGIMAAVRRFRS